MSMDEVARDHERELWDARQTRAPWEPIERDGTPIDLDLAYAVQDLLVARLRRESGADVVGYKVGLTNPAMWELCGVSESIVGRILSTNVEQDGAAVALADFGRLGIESEIAVRIGRTVPVRDGGVDADVLLDCIESVHAAFEIIDDRGADYTRLDAASIAAENSWQAGVVLGEGRSPDVLGGLAGRAAEVYVDDVLVGTGNSNDVLGGPLNVLAWLQRHLTRSGNGLQAGQYVMTGSLIATRFPAVGDAHRLEVDGLPAVRVHVV